MLVAVLVPVLLAVLLAVAVVTVETITVERRMRPRQLSPITERTNNVRWYYHGARSTRRTRTTRQEQEQEGVNDGYKTSTKQSVRQRNVGLRERPNAHQQKKV